MTFEDIILLQLHHPSISNKYEDHTETKLLRNKILEEPHIKIKECVVIVYVRGSSVEFLKKIQKNNNKI